MLERSTCRPELSFSAAGFTIVELILVIALLGILSAVAISQFGNTQTYHDLQLKDQLISIARVAQQAALNRHNQKVSLKVSRPGNDKWLLTVAAAYTDSDGKDRVNTLKDQSINPSQAVLTAPGVGVINAATSATIEFDNLGNVSSSAIADSNLAFDVSGNTVCITLAGYAYQAVDANDCITN